MDEKIVPFLSPSDPARTPLRSARRQKAKKSSMNFKMSSEFRTTFKTFAAAHDLSMQELFEKMFELYRLHDTTTTTSDVVGKEITK